MKKCPSCGQEVNDDASYCPKCGTSLIETIANEKYCVKCGEKLDSDVEFCPKCGARQNPVPSTPVHHVATTSSGTSVASLVLGIISVSLDTVSFFVFGWLSIPSFIMSIIGIALGTKHFNTDPKAKAGVILSIIALVASVVALICWIIILVALIKKV